jgi:hypothetical protein
MIPVGYMAKRVSGRPDWLDAPQVVDIYSVSDCISDDFADYINYWKHNGYWFFDSPEIIQQLALENSIDLTGTRLFYYEVYELEFDADDEGEWLQFEPSFPTKVVAPTTKILEGFDVVSFYAGSSPECSLLSCNGVAKELETNMHCLLTSLEEAKRLLETGAFERCEPGPYRVFAVYSVVTDSIVPSTPVF